MQNARQPRADGRRTRNAIHREAVSLVDRLQRLGRELESPQYLPYQVAFDVDKLTWELNFFTRNFFTYELLTVSRSLPD